MQKISKFILLSAIIHLSIISSASGEKLTVTGENLKCAAFFNFPNRWQFIYNDSFRGEVDELLTKRIQELKCLFRLVDAPASGMAFAVVDRDGKSYSRGMGLAHDNGQGNAVKINTRFPLASISKLFTAIAIFQLIDEQTPNPKYPHRAMSLDDKLTDYVNFSMQNLVVKNQIWSSSDSVYGDITLNQLLLHSSGLAGDASGTMRYSQEELFTNGKPNPDGRPKLSSFSTDYASYYPAGAPGEESAYCNGCYILLSEVIENASGLSFEAYFQEKVFKPIGMRDSSAASHIEACEDGFGGECESKWTIENKFSEGFNRIDGTSVGTPQNALLPFGQLQSANPFGAGSGGITSSARDMAKFMRVLLNNGEISGTSGGRLLSPIWMEKLLSAPPSSKKAKLDSITDRHYGYGWDDATVTDRGFELHKDGGMGSYSRIVINPESGIGVWVVANQGGDRYHTGPKPVPIAVPIITAMQAMNAMFEHNRLPIASQSAVTFRRWTAQEVQDFSGQQYFGDHIDFKIVKQRHPLWRYYELYLQIPDLNDQKFKIRAVKNTGGRVLAVPAEGFGNLVGLPLAVIRTMFPREKTPMLLEFKNRSEGYVDRTYINLTAKVAGFEISENLKQLLPYFDLPLLNPAQKSAWLSRAGFKEDGSFSGQQIYCDSEITRSSGEKLLRYDSDNGQFFLAGDLVIPHDEYFAELFGTGRYGGIKLRFSASDVEKTMYHYGGEYKLVGEDKDKCLAAHYSGPKNEDVLVR